MKITDTELNIINILDVRRGKMHQGKRECRCRHSDCFVYICSGAADYYFGTSVYKVQEGDLLFLSYRSRYSMNIKSNSYSYIYVDFFFDRENIEELSNMIYSSDRLSETENKFHKLYKLWKIGDYADKLYCKALLYTVYSQVAKSELTKYVSGKRKSDIELAAKYMSDHLSDSNMNISTLAELCNVSEVHFRRLFKCVYHTSPAKFINVLRIKKAKELLASDDCRISQISERCGFENHYYFSKVFKSLTSLTPTEYRNRYKNTV